MQSLLVVDDDEILRSLLKRYFSSHGFEVETANDWQEMSTLLGSRRFHLYLLDVNLPGLSGVDICKTLRDDDDQTPIIMLTAQGADQDRINGLKAGADDYLPKPFNSEELLVRVKAVLRRHAYIPNDAVAQTKSFRFDAFEYNAECNSLFRGETRVPLTGHELALLKILYHHRGRPVTRDLISQHLNGIDYQPDQRSIDILVHKLRKSLGDAGPDYLLIQTIRGRGYMLVRG